MAGVGVDPALQHYIDDAVHNALDSALHHSHDAGRSLLQLPDSFGEDNVNNPGSLVESLNQLRQAVENVQDSANSKADATSTNIFFVIYGGTIVFLMQLGFAMLTSGFVRTKNINNILLKNLMDASVASICWYVLGYGFSYGVSDHRSNAFIGNHDFALTHTVQQNWALAHPEDDGGHLAGNLGGYFFQWAFVATTATIVSGGVAERITFVAYMSYVVWMVSWVYPVLVHAVWASGGWLSAYVPDDTPVEEWVGAKEDGEWTFADAWGKGAAILNTGAMDYAGSGVVHLTGGLAALIGAWFLGPRVGRFKDDGSLNEDMNSSSNVLVVFGTLILWFGWYAFNPGSQLAVATPGNATIVARNAVNTTMAAAAGGITCLFFKYWRTGQLCVLSTCNGILSGMVGVTAGPSLYEPWAAIICGSIGALVFYGSEVVMHKLQIDDPVGAWSVHGSAGIYSVLYVGFFAKHDYVKEVYGNPVSSRRYGWFYGGHGQVMLCNVIELIFIILWVGINFYLLFGLFYYTKKLRVPPEVEHAGLDASFHGSKKSHMYEGSNGAHLDLTISAEEKDGVKKKNQSTDSDDS